MIILNTVFFVCLSHLDNYRDFANLCGKINFKITILNKTLHDQSLRPEQQKLKQHNLRYQNQK